MTLTPQERDRARKPKPKVTLSPSQHDSATAWACSVTSLLLAAIRSVVEKVTKLRQGFCDWVGRLRYLRYLSCCFKERQIWINLDKKHKVTNLIFEGEKIGRETNLTQILSSRMNCQSSKKSFYGRWITCKFRRARARKSLFGKLHSMRSLYSIHRVQTRVTKLKENKTRRLFCKKKGQSSTSVYVHKLMCQ